MTVNTIALLDADRDIKPGPVPRDVLDYWRKKRLKPGFDYRDVWGAEHDTAFTAAKVMREDVLAVMQEELDIALEQGRPFAAFKRSIAPRMKSLGWWDEQEVEDPKTGDVVRVKPPQRLKLIFDTNMRASRAVGQWDRVQTGAKQRPYLLYQVGPSLRHREQHLAWHGVLLPVDNPFWTYAFPPNGYNCRCAVRSVSKTEYSRLVDAGTIAGQPEPILDDDGYPTGHVRQTKTPVITKAPRVPLVPWTNARTGETILVRKGIDPGFDKRPGEGRDAALKKRAPPLAKSGRKKR